MRNPVFTASFIYKFINGSFMSLISESPCPSVVIKFFLSQFGIQCITHPVSEKVDGQDQDCQRNTWKNNHPPFAGKQKILADANQRSQ